MKQQIKEFLNLNESSASALILVISSVRGDLSDQEIDQIYEQSEGKNDSDRDLLIDSMSTDELLKVAENCLEIANERFMDNQE